jgi:hypothetical protein
MLICKLEIGSVKPNEFFSAVDRSIRKMKAILRFPVIMRVLKTIPDH